MSCRLFCIIVYDDTCIGAFNANSNGSSSSTCYQEVTIAWFHAILNHALIIVNTVAVISLCKYDKIPTIIPFLLSFAFAIAFQLYLCLFIVDCVGVSIIWCFEFGWLLVRKKATIFTRAVSFLDCCAILFYAINNAVITTIAHVLAALLGVLFMKVSVIWLNILRLMRLMREEKSN